MIRRFDLLLWSITLVYHSGLSLWSIALVRAAAGDARAIRFGLQNSQRNQAFMKSMHQVIGLFRRFFELLSFFAGGFQKLFGNKPNTHL